MTFGSNDIPFADTVTRVVSPVAVTVFEDPPEFPPSPEPKPPPSVPATSASTASAAVTWL